MVFACVVCCHRPSAHAETRLVAEDDSSTTCEALQVDLSSIGMDVSATVPNRTKGGRGGRRLPVMRSTRWRCVDPAQIESMSSTPTGRGRECLLLLFLPKMIRLWLLCT